MKNRRVSLQRFIFSGMATLSLLVTLVALSSFLYRDFKDFSSRAEEIRTAYVNEMKRLVRTEVQQVDSFVRYNWQRTEREVKREVKARTEEAHVLVSALYERYRGTMSEAQLLELARETLRGLRYNGGRGYFFATRLDGVVISFADRPELEGKQLIDMQDSRGKYVIREIVDLVRREGEGYIHYTWTKPDSDGHHHPKIAYIKHFEPFGGFIGTGEYIEDVERDIQKHALERIGDIRFGKDGYIFVVSYDGVTLMNGVQPELIGLNIWDMSDPYGVKVIQEERRVADIPGGDFITYHWQKPSTGKIAPKVSYVIGFPEWEWMYGAGVYADEVEAQIGQLQADFTRRLHMKAAFTLFILLLGMWLLLYYSRRFSIRLKGQIRQFSDFFETMPVEGRPVDMDAVSIADFVPLGEAANRMLAAKKRAEADLGESQRFVSTLLANLSGMVYRCHYDPAWTMEFISEGSLGLTGYGPDELIQNRSIAYGELIVESHRELVYRTIAEALHAGHPFRAVYKIRHKNGQERWVWEQGRGVFDETGAVVALEGFITDISDLKQAEADIRKFKAVADKASYGMGIATLDGRLVYVNDYFALKHGLTVDDCLGRHLTIFHHKDHHEQVEALVRILIEKGSFQLREVPHWRRGEPEAIFPMLMNGTLIEGQNGEPSYVAVTAVDVSRQHEMERDKKRLENQLIQAQKMESIGRLAGGIAHDFNNLLTGISGHIELALLDLNPADPLYATLAEVSKATESASYLTRQLLAFSRKQVIEPKVMNLHDVVEHLGRMLQRLIGENVELRTVFDSSGKDRVRVDFGQVQQILVNLAVNARDAMPDGGKLTIETACVTLDEAYFRGRPEGSPGEYVMLAVSDNGCGMTEEVRSRLFEPFFTTKERGKGTGLGLSTVYGAVKQNRGLVEVYSEPGNGTTIKVYFPRVDEAVGPLGRPVDKDMPLGSERIFLVEDEAIVRELAVKVLTRLGYEVQAFPSGEEAIKALALHTGPLDLLITDVIMPGINGRVTAEQARALRPDLKVLFTSGYTENVIAHHGVLDSGIEFIAKPYTPQALAQKVRGVLESGGSAAPA